MKAQYAASPAWLQDADERLGRRAQLLPRTRIRQVKPRVITRFEPWMALTLQRGQHRRRHREREPRRARRRSTARQRRAAVAAGSTRPGYAGADGLERHRDRAVEHASNHHALLLINPHTSFFFRSELQMTSDEGLNAYGAVTWGQFFIYQGFNDRAGWMHTSSGVDDIDEYLETVVEEGRRLLLQVRQRGAAARDASRSPCRTRPRAGMAQKDVHRLPHAPRADRPRGRRQVGQRPADAGADRRR